MTYAAAQAWLDEFANVEQRLNPAAWAGVKLERVVRLLELLDRPHRHGRVVHIAGSKGKGSTAAMTASILRAAGWRVGLYTSPHLVSPRERIRIDGQPITEAMAAELVDTQLRPAAEAYGRAADEGPLTFFDLHTALAFLAFQAAKVDWSVLEVGLGGRLDATNVVQPRVCAITSLSLEHTALLGGTLAEIAGEKAGIIKPGVPVISAPQAPEAAAVLARVAAERGAPLTIASGAVPEPSQSWVETPDGRIGQRLRLGWRGRQATAFLPLLGEHQVENAAVARTIAEVIAAQEGRPALEAVLAGLADVRWPGRLEVLGRRPWLVLDGAHTPHAAARLANSLTAFPHQRRYFVLGSANDKDFRGLVELLCPGAAGAVVTGLPGNPRTASPDRLLPVLCEVVPTAAARPSPAEALALAQSWAGPDDLICVSGSLYLVGAVLADLHGPEPV